MDQYIHATQFGGAAATVVVLSKSKDTRNIRSDEGGLGAPRPASRGFSVPMRYPGIVEMLRHMVGLPPPGAVGGSGGGGGGGGAGADSSDGVGASAGAGGGGQATRVALMHCELLVAHHNLIQKYVCELEELGAMPLIVVTHNNGERDGRAGGCSLRLNAGFDTATVHELLEMFRTPRQFADESEVFPWDLAQQRLSCDANGAVVGGQLGSVDDADDVRRVTFCARILISDILAMVRSTDRWPATQQDSQRLPPQLRPDQRPPLHHLVQVQRFLADVRIRNLSQRPAVVIISGKMGNRGTVFKSTGHGLHLTDMFVSLGANPFNQVRCAGRARAPNAPPCTCAQ